MAKVDTKAIFETMPVPKALATLAIPTIMSQIISLVYNMADTYFIGMADDPSKTASTSVSYVLVFFQMSITYLFSVGGGTLISRLLGQKKDAEARNVAAFSFYATILTSILYIAMVNIFMEDLLKVMGAIGSIEGYCRTYILWVITVGGIPYSLNITMAQMLRSVGHAKFASYGLMSGGILNMLLDPLFMFVILPLGNEVAGAAIATMTSNSTTTFLFIFMLIKLQKETVLSISPVYVNGGKKYIGEILSVGFPSAISACLNSMSGMILNNMVSRFGDVPLAAMGIVTKIDSLPLSISMGICQGMMPLVAYNYAAKDYKRMSASANCARVWAMIFAACCIVMFEIFTRPVFSLFIGDPETIAYGVRFLRVCCLATPFMVCNVQMNYMFQSMGRGKESLFLAICRRGLVHIPLLFFINHFFGLFGLIWTQATSDAITLIISLSMYRHFQKKLWASLEE